MKKADIQKEAMIEALRKSLGIVTTACNEVGISRRTHYDWLESDTNYKQAVESIDDIALDFAESHLLKQIKEGEVSSTIFYLKTKGRKRGYVEKKDIELSGGMKINSMTDEQLDSQINTLRKLLGES